MSWFNFHKKEEEKKETPTVESEKQADEKGDVPETPEVEKDEPTESVSEKSNETVESQEPAADEKSETEENSDDSDADSEEKAYEHGLAKSRSAFGKKLNALFANFRSVDDDFFDDLEDTLIGADVGVDTAVNLTDELREEVKTKNVKNPDEIKKVIVQKMIDLYDAPTSQENDVHFADEGPTVILFVGVNGVGKTTTVGKLANLYKQAGKKVLLTAADTFRAGAIEQLDEWAKRDGVDIVKKPEGSDPASVVFEAMQKAKKEHHDVVFVDTAGRLQNKVNLMNELGKIDKIIKREIPDAPQETLLVLDATTGQNAMNQAKMFNEVTNITGIVLTKLDGTAKGGIVIAIKNNLNLPVKFVGLGEQVNDLKKFEPNEFITNLFKGLI